MFSVFLCFFHEILASAHKTGYYNRIGQYVRILITVEYGKEGNAGESRG